MRDLIRLIENASKPQPKLNDAFKRWFRNSKVVDQNGKPSVVFHGGADSIETFDLNAIGRSSGKDRERVWISQSSFTTLRTRPTSN